MARFVIKKIKKNLQQSTLYSLKSKENVVNIVNEEPVIEEVKIKKKSSKKENKVEEPVIEENKENKVQEEVL